MTYIRPTDGKEIKLSNNQANVLEDLEQSALSRTSESPTGRLLLGVGAFTLVVAPLGIYIAGLAASPFVVSAIKKALKDGQQGVYLRQSGNFAHLLKESELVQLTKSIGKDSVAHQLMEAHQDGHRMTSAAKKYLELAGSEVQKLTLENLFAGKLDTPKTVSVKAVELKEPAIEQGNQGDVVAVLSPTAITDEELSEIYEQDTEPASAEVKPVAKQNTKHSPPTALDKLLASPYLSRAIFGGQRTGKSNLVSIASAKLAEKGAKIYHINLLSYMGKGDEDAQYTKHCEKSIRADFSHMYDSNERTVIVSECIQMVQDWWDAPGQAVLIFDEFAYAASVAVPETAPLLQLIASNLAATSSSGIKREHSLWTLSPTMVAGEMQESGKRIKSLKPVMVAISPGHTEEWQGNKLSFDTSLYTDVNRNFGQVMGLPTAASVPGETRIAWVDGGWCALGTYNQAAKKKEEPAEDTELTDLLIKIAVEIKKQAAKKDGGHITVRSAAQCLPSNTRSKHYPKMAEYCAALAELYPEEFKMMTGKAGESRIAHLKAPTYNEFQVSR